MATNPYFSNNEGNLSEQNLQQSLVDELIALKGQDVMYLPRTMVDTDRLYGEDIRSEFKEAITIEMMLKDVTGFEGQSDFISQFGIELRSSANFVLSKTRFEEEFPSFDRPREGDLIYWPLSKSLFEVKFVEHENPFFQFGSLYTYDLSVELYRYSEEDFDTGIKSIDSVEQDHSYYLDLVLAADGSGAFAERTAVYQGSVGSESAEGQVRSHDVDGLNLRIINVKGEWSEGIAVKDSDGNEWTVSVIEDITMRTDPFFDDDNTIIESEADQITDFSESDPFSEGDF